MLKLWVKALGLVVFFVLGKTSFIKPTHDSPG